MMSETRRLQLRILWTGTLVLLPLAAHSVAQDAPAPVAKVAAPGRADQAAEQPKQEAPPPETDPFVLAVLEVKPTTPEQWLRDIRALVHLNRPQLAKEYLAQFSAALPPPAELAQLHARFGSAFFLELSTREALQPEGATVADAIMQAADARMRDPTRLAGLVDRLGGQDPAARRLAMADLVEAGPAAAPALVQALADPTKAAAHAAVLRTLTAIGPSAAGALTAALQSPDTRLQAAILAALGNLQSRDVVVDLLGPALREDADAAVRAAGQRALEQVLGRVPSRSEALGLLTRRIDELFSGTAPHAVDQDGNVTLWTWDRAQQLLVARRLPAAEAAWMTATELARQRHLIAPSREDYRLTYLVAVLELAQREAGYDRALDAAATPVVQELTEAHVDLLEAVLDQALRRRSVGAALAAIELLGDRRDPALVESAGGQPRLVVRALVDPHRRVQVAAARAIMQCAPQRPYAGSSYLPALLGHLAATGGRLRVLIGEPRVSVAQELAGYFHELGYATDTAFAGRALALQAMDSPDYAFALVGDAIDQPGLVELVQVLRRDPRTADLPLGIMAREVNMSAARRLADEDRLTVVLAPPQTRDDVTADVQRLLQAAGRQFLSVDERLAEAAFAMDALATLAADPKTYGFYELMQLEPRVLQALRTPALSVEAGRVLGLLGSPTAQEALVEFASAQLQPLAARQAAAAAFRDAVGRRGLLLTRSRLQHQYDLYNASEPLDRETQAVLASILDTFEASARQADAPGPAP